MIIDNILNIIGTNTKLGYIQCCSIYRIYIFADLRRAYWFTHTHKLTRRTQHCLTTHLKHYERKYTDLEYIGSVRHLNAFFPSPEQAILGAKL
jgi:hypothetical protein